MQYTEDNCGIELRYFYLGAIEHVHGGEQATLILYW
jgi:hypothetical protein